MADEKKSIGPEAVKPAEAPAQGQADPVKAAPPEQASPPTPGKVVDFAAAREEAEKDKAAAQKAAPQKAPADKSDGANKPRRGRPAKADKAAPSEAAAPKRDKKSQNKTAAEKAPAKDKAAPAQPEQPPEPRDASRGEKEEVVYLNLSELHPFKNHPFGIRDDTEMQGLVESVKASGVNQPALVRHREHILPTEKAQSLKMQVEAIKHQGARPGEDAKDAGKRSTQVVGDRNGMNYKQVQRYIRLTELVPDLKKMVGEKKLSFTPAVEISFIRPKNQRYIAVSIEGQQSSPSLSQAQKLRELDKDGKLNGDVIDGILSQEKKEVDRVIINSAELEKYFAPREMKDQIISLLEDWKAKQPPELAKPEKKAEKAL